MSSEHKIVAIAWYRPQDWARPRPVDGAARSEFAVEKLASDN
jgi:hypothetical protein